MNVTSLDQCAAVHESDHTEWRNSMVDDPIPEAEGESAASAESNTVSIGKSSL